MEGKNLSKEQMNVESVKFQVPFTAEHISRKIELPHRYGKDRIIAMTRDPWWIFTYWEITPAKEKAIREAIEHNGEHFEKSVLRIYDITGMPDFKPGRQNSFFDIALKDLAKNWYVDVGAPGRRWCVEIGMLSREGNFYALATSNIINTPRFGMSDIFDEAWMLSEEEYWWLFGASGGFDVGKSSLEMKELFLRQLKEWISSGGLISLGSFVLQKK
ncbi:MAG: DUF4912 domain-containing protein [Candidatus Omnitrophota bacterium]